MMIPTIPDHTGSRLQQQQNMSNIAVKKDDEYVLSNLKDGPRWNVSTGMLSVFSKLRSCV